MNTLAVIIFSLAVAVSQVAPQEYSEKAKATIAKCTEQNPSASTSIINDVKLPENDDDRCLLDCLFKGIGMVVDGEFSPSATEKLLQARFSSAEDRTNGHKLIEFCTEQLKTKSDEKCWFGKAIRDCKIKSGIDIKLL